MWEGVLLWKYVKMNTKVCTAEVGHWKYLQTFDLLWFSSWVEVPFYLITQSRFEFLWEGPWLPSLRPIERDRETALLLWHAGLLWSFNRTSSLWICTQTHRTPTQAQDTKGKLRHTVNSSIEGRCMRQDIVGGSEGVGCPAERFWFSILNELYLNSL